MFAQRLRRGPRRRMLSVALCSAVAAGSMVIAAPAASANTALPDGSSLSSFVAASTPQWNFARANDHDACWPSAALTGSGGQDAGADLKGWPVPGQGGCPDRGTAFPTYYSVKQCTSTEVRVIFNIYIRKDGFSGSLFGNNLGHRYDWEHVALVWVKGSDGSWYRDHLLLGRHGEHVYQDWDTAESWNAARTSAGTGLEYPRIFVGWAKHAMFNHQGGGTDIISQYTDKEYRSAAYPYWAGDLQQVTDDNALATTLGGYNWGSATSNPAVMSRSLCSITADR